MLGYDANVGAVDNSDDFLWLLLGQATSTRYISNNGGRSWREDIDFDQPALAHNIAPFGAPITRTNGAIAYTSGVSTMQVISPDDSVASYSETTIDAAGSYDGWSYMRVDKDVSGAYGALFDAGSADDFRSLYWRNYEANEDTDTTITSLQTGTGGEGGVSGILSPDYDQEVAHFSYFSMRNASNQLEYYVKFGISGDDYRTATYTGTYAADLHAQFPACSPDNAILMYATENSGIAYLDLDSGTFSTVDLTNAYESNDDNANVDIDCICYDKMLGKFIASGQINDGGANNDKLVTYIIDPATQAVDSFTVHDEVFADYNSVNDGRHQQKTFALTGLASVSVMAARNSSGDLVMWWSDDGFVTKAPCTFDTTINGVTDIAVVKALSA